MLIHVRKTDEVDQFNPLDPTTTSYYIAKHKGKNNPFEFLTRDDVYKKNGKRHWFHESLTKAKSFKTYEEAINVARRFVHREDLPTTKFYVSDFQRATVLFFKSVQLLEKINQNVTYMISDYWNNKLEN